MDYYLKFIKQSNQLNYNYQFPLVTELSPYPTLNKGSEIYGI